MRGFLLPGTGASLLVADQLLPLGFGRFAYWSVELFHPLLQRASPCRARRSLPR